jgi:hypothetical protein
VSVYCYIASSELVNFRDVGHMNHSFIIFFCGLFRTTGSR